jgi:adenylate kinase family enzyme
MKIEEITQVVDEGIHDQHIFKCVFLIGSPGSGKTFVSNKLFASSGLKKVNLDDMFELIATKNGEDLKTLSSTEKGKHLIDQSWEKIIKKRDLHMHGRLGIIMDITGRRLDRVLQPKQMFEELGYECFCVIVNTDLKTAMKRNSERNRSVPEYFLVKSFNEVKENFGEIQKAFGAQNTMIIDNREDSVIEWDYYWKQIQKFLNKPLSHVAKQWLEYKKSI